MQNETERLIEELLARKEADFQRDRACSAAPGVTDLMDVALGNVAPGSELATRVRAYCADDPEHAARLAALEAAARNEEVQPAPVQGSYLERAAVPEREREPRPGGGL